MEKPIIFYTIESSDSDSESFPRWINEPNKKTDQQRNNSISHHFEGSNKLTELSNDNEEQTKCHLPIRESISDDKGDSDDGNNKNEDKESEKLRQRSLEDENDNDEMTKEVNSHGRSEVDRLRENRLEENVRRDETREVLQDAAESKKKLENENAVERTLHSPHQGRSEVDRIRESRLKENVRRDETREVLQDAAESKKKLRFLEDESEGKETTKKVHSNGRSEADRIRENRRKEKATRDENMRVVLQNESDGNNKMTKTLHSSHHHGRSEEEERIRENRLEETARKDEMRVVLQDVKHMNKKLNVKWCRTLEIKASLNKFFISSSSSSSEIQVDDDVHQNCSKTWNCNVINSCEDSSLKTIIILSSSDSTEKITALRDEMRVVLQDARHQVKKLNAGGVKWKCQTEENKSSLETIIISSSSSDTEVEDDQNKKELLPRGFRETGSNCLDKEAERKASFNRIKTSSFSQEKELDDVSQKSIMDSNRPKQTWNDNIKGCYKDKKKTKTSLNRSKTRLSSSSEPELDDGDSPKSVRESDRSKQTWNDWGNREEGLKKKSSLKRRKVMPSPSSLSSSDTELDEDSQSIRESRDILKWRRKKERGLKRDVSVKRKISSFSDTEDENPNFKRREKRRLKRERTSTDIKLSDRKIKKSSSKRMITSSSSETEDEETELDDQNRRERNRKTCNCSMKMVKDGKKTNFKRKRMSSYSSSETDDDEDSRYTRREKKRRLKTLKRMKWSCDKGHQVKSKRIVLSNSSSSSTSDSEEFEVIPSRNGRERILISNGKDRVKKVSLKRMISASSSESDEELLVSREKKKREKSIKTLNAMWRDNYIDKGRLKRIILVVSSQSSSETEEEFHPRNRSRKKSKYRRSKTLNAVIKCCHKKDDKKSCLKRRKISSTSSSSEKEKEELDDQKTKEGNGKLVKTIPSNGCGEIGKETLTPEKKKTLPNSSDGVLPTHQVGNDFARETNVPLRIMEVFGSVPKTSSPSSNGGEITRETLTSENKKTLPISSAEILQTHLQVDHDLARQNVPLRILEVFGSVPYYQFEDEKQVPSNDQNEVECCDVMQAAKVIIAGDVIQATKVSADVIDEQSATVSVQVIEAEKDDHVTTMADDNNTYYSNRLPDCVYLSDWEDNTLPLRNDHEAFEESPIRTFSQFFWPKDKEDDERWTLDYDDDVVEIDVTSPEENQFDVVDEVKSPFLVNDEATYYKKSETVITPFTPVSRKIPNLFTKSPASSATSSSAGSANYSIPSLPKPSAKRVPPSAKEIGPTGGAKRPVGPKEGSVNNKNQRKDMFDNSVERALSRFSNKTKDPINCTWSQRKITLETPSVIVRPATKSPEQAQGAGKNKNWTPKHDADSSNRRSKPRRRSKRRGPSSGYCICGRRQGRQPMIACDECKEWFHPRCVNLSSRDFWSHCRNPSQKWLCPKCCDQGRILRPRDQLKTSPKYRES